MSDSKEYAVSTLEETPVRVLTFLRAAGTSVAIRSLLAARGYTDSDHEEGWRLLHKVSGLRPAAVAPPADRSVSDAINTLDGWDEDGYSLVDAALTRRFPEQAKFVLEGLAPAKGAASVLSVKNLLERIDALESSPERKATRKQDQAAVAAIAAKGITQEERARLRGLVDLAQTAVKAAPTDTGASEQVERVLLEDLRALRAWYDEWAKTAKVAIKRRDYLISLGLAKRKTKKDKTDLSEPWRPGAGVPRAPARLPSSEKSKNFGANRRARG